MTGVRDVGDIHAGRRPDSGRADRILQDAFPRQKAQETILIQGPRGATVADARVRAAVRDVARSVDAQPGVRSVRSALGAGGGDLVSADRRSALVTFDVAGDEEAPALLGPELAAAGLPK